MKYILKNLLFAFILVFPISCSTIDVTVNMTRNKNGYYANKAFKVYVDDFKKRSNIKEISYNIVFGKLSYSKNGKKGVIGTCNFVSERITIDTKYWKKSTNIEKESLIFHELGHCQLNRQHTSPKTSDGSIMYYIENIGYILGILETKEDLIDGCPASHMHPYDISNECLWAHRDYYNKELFNKNSKFYNTYSEDENEVIGSALIFNVKLCPEPIKINETEEEWKQIDTDNMEHAIKRCPIVTGLQCLKVFKKKEPLVYHVICGDPR